ncbi:MAG: hypothetical protein INR69_21820, partial [Mucilaginibacter polytrichastri]|nr:hypothetical protein [Mucilaginibacter polytrichastri]
MKNILIPTDFTAESLEQIGMLAERDNTNRFRIMLVHFIKLSDSIPELMLLSQRTKEYAYITDEFIAQIEAWRKQYGSQIQSIRAEFFYGSTAAVFQNYLEANDIEEIAYDANYSWKKACKNSIDPAMLIVRSGLPVTGLDKEVIKTTAREEFAAGRIAGQLVPSA